MSEHAHPQPPAGDKKPRRIIGFDLRSYLDRQHAEFADGPTMADILDDLDKLRRTDGPSRDDIVRALHESRDERDEQLEAIWKR